MLPDCLLVIVLHTQPLTMGLRHLKETLEKHLRLGPSANVKEINQLNQQPGLAATRFSHRIS
jgi:hypothetical protein